MKGNKHLYAQVDEHGSCQYDPRIVAFVMAQIADDQVKQVSLKAGVGKWGNEAIKAATSEMKQLHWHNTFKPLHYKNLTDEEKKMVLESHIFLTQKRTGEIKARTTVSGRNKQRDYISKEDVSSPTVATESVLLTCTIDALEERDVAVIDIPNAFIQTKVADKKNQVVIRIRGMVAEILVKIAPEIYGPFIGKDKKGQSISNLWNNGSQLVVL